MRENPLPTHFYVYALLDPRKPGSFCFNRFKMPFEPFYIGKGKNGRAEEHFKSSTLAKKLNNPRHNKIRSILRSGHEVVVKYLKRNLNEQDAYDLERKMVKTVGRKDLKTGPLLNLCDGGRGPINLKFSEEAKKAVSDSKKAMTAQQKVLRKERFLESFHGRSKEDKEISSLLISSARAGSVLTASHKNSISASMKISEKSRLSREKRLARWSSLDKDHPEKKKFSQKISEVVKSRSPEMKAHVKAKIRETYSLKSPEEKAAEHERRSKAVAEAWARRKAKST